MPTIDSCIPRFLPWYDVAAIRVKRQTADKIDMIDHETGTLAGTFSIFHMISCSQSEADSAIKNGIAGGEFRSECS
jgi:hypothetical protein